MSDLNSQHNRAVWFDIPVSDLDRAVGFYAAVLGVGVEKSTFGDFTFGILAHEHGNGGCLVPNPDEAGAARGILLYLNVNGRIRDAVSQVKAKGGSVLEDTHPIGPHGFRALITDSEGNRLALHSPSDG
ncbi:VOC family protein [Tahibacter amnicola]|uniref:VOC family protein n=1 Tax=Tahibacter amnicola TaxID=2976241 RepID=A0ABY6BIQ3_9GAMM|nr:VOC family protein [Tahibacter amnicola]UXI69891.1 VOC family protein [Tahibacter amnicola]